MLGPENKDNPGPTHRGSQIFERGGQQCRDEDGQRFLPRETPKRRAKARGWSSVPGKENG